MPERISQQAVQASFNVAAAASPYASYGCVDSWLTDFRDDLPKIDIPTLVVHGTAVRNSVAATVRLTRKAATPGVHSLSGVVAHCRGLIKNCLSSAPPGAAPARPMSPTSPVIAEVSIDPELQLEQIREHPVHRRGGAPWPDVTSVAFYPGIVRSNFAADSAALRIFYRYAPFLVTPQNAGARLVGLATLPAAELTNGAYYEGDKAKRVSRPAAHADDTAAAATLWDASAKAVGL